MSDLRDFLNWFEGFSDNIDETPTAIQWGKVKTRIAALKDAVVDAPAGTVAAKPATPAPSPPKKVEMVYNFIIDHEGYARNGRTREQVLPSQVADTLFDLRGMDGDMKSIVWADGSTGLNGADLNIVAA